MLYVIRSVNKITIAKPTDRATGEPGRAAAKRQKAAAKPCISQQASPMCTNGSRNLYMRRMCRSVDRLFGSFVAGWLVCNFYTLNMHYA